MPTATFCSPDLTTFCHLDELGLTAVGQRLEPDRTVLECRVNEPDPWCHSCGAEGTPRDTAIRALAHEPFGHRPTLLKIRIRRFRCARCRKVWREDTARAALERAKISRVGVRWALEALVLDHITVARAAANLGVSWHTAILHEGRRLLLDDPTRFDQVTTIGVDEHVWQHTRRGDKYVTVIIDFTPVREQTGPARLLDMVEGRSKQVFSDWLAAGTQAWRDRIEPVAMDWFTGFKTASNQHLSDATEVMDPFHVVQLAGDALDRVRQRVQQETRGHRGRRGDPLYQIRRVLRTGEAFLTEKQRARLDAVFADAPHADVWRACRVYRHIARSTASLDGSDQRELINVLKATTPAWFVELRKLAHTLDRRRADILAYFDHPGTSNGPTEGINGRLEHLRDSALGFQNLTHYIARSLLEAGGFRPRLHPQMR